MMLRFIIYTLLLPLLFRLSRGLITPKLKQLENDLLLTRRSDIFSTKNDSESQFIALLSTAHAKRAGEDAFWQRGPAFSESYAQGLQNRLRREDQQVLGQEDPLVPRVQDIDDTTFTDRSQGGSQLSGLPQEVKTEMENLNLPDIFDSDLFAEYHWSNGAQKQLTIWSSSALKTILVKLWDDKIDADNIASKICASWHKINVDAPMTNPPYLLRSIIFIGVSNRKTLETITDVLMPGPRGDDTAVVRDSMRIAAPNFQANPESEEGRYWDTIQGTPIFNSVEQLLWKWRVAFQQYEVLETSMALKRTSRDGVISANVFISLGQSERGIRVLSSAIQVEDVMDEDMEVEDSNTGYNEEYDSGSADMEIDTDGEGSGDGEENSTGNGDGSSGPGKDKGKQRAPKNVPNNSGSDFGAVMNCASLLPEGNEVSEAGFMIQELGDGQISVHPRVEAGSRKISKTLWGSQDTYTQRHIPSYRSFIARYRYQKVALEHSGRQSTFAEFEVATSGRDNHLVVTKMPSSLEPPSSEDRQVPFGDILHTIWCKSHGSQQLTTMSFIAFTDRMLKYLRALNRHKEFEAIPLTDPLRIDGDSEHILKSQLVVGWSPSVEIQAVKEIAGFHLASPPIELRTLEITSRAVIQKKKSEKMFLVYLGQRGFESSDNADRADTVDVGDFRDYLACIDRGIQLDIRMSVTEYHVFERLDPEEEERREESLKLYQFKRRLPSMGPATDKLFESFLAASRVDASSKLTAEELMAASRPRYIQILVTQPEDQTRMALWLNRKHGHLIVESFPELSSMGKDEEERIYMKQELERVLLKALVMAKLIPFDPLSDEKLDPDYGQSQEGGSVPVKADKEEEGGVSFISILSFSRASIKIIETAYRRAELSKAEILHLKYQFTCRTTVLRNKRLRKEPRATKLPYESAYGEFWYAILGTDELSLITNTFYNYRERLDQLRISRLFLRWTDRGTVQKGPTSEVQYFPEVLLQMRHEYRLCDDDGNLSNILKDKGLTTTLIRVESEAAKAATILGFSPPRNVLLGPNYILEPPIVNPPSDPQYWPFPYQHGPSGESTESPVDIWLRSGAVTEKAKVQRFKHTIFSVYNMKSPISGESTATQSSKDEHREYSIAVHKKSFLKGLVLTSAKNWDKLDVVQQRDELAGVFFSVWQQSGGQRHPSSDELSYLLRGQLNDVLRSRSLRTITIVRTCPESSKLIKQYNVGPGMKLPYTLDTQQQNKDKTQALIDSLIFALGEVAAVRNFLSKFSIYLGAPLMKFIYIEPRSDGDYTIVIFFTPDVEPYTDRYRIAA